MTFEEAKILKGKYPETITEDKDTYQVLIAPIDKEGWHKYITLERGIVTTDESALKYSSDFGLYKIQFIGNNLTWYRLD